MTVWKQLGHVSSMLSGERRWASSRRGGMTVLGKVAVPKPINLPSQRLENHGLDPNVEIVPKGTLSWGSRSSSSASNAWGSSSLSPNTDGGTSSPNCVSAHPSSGGSGPRPSTAGGDRAPEPTSNAWGSNSRPSSASGTLTSVRPHSAETKPGGSQLSRLTESSVTWSAARTIEKLGVAQGKSDDFSVSAGDFPILGSEKDKLVENSELQDHSSHNHPESTSGQGKVETETPVDDAPVNADVKDGAVSSWRRDYPACSEDGVGPATEKWQANLQHYPNAGFPPQHYDAWHGPPVNNPQGGVWFRGLPAGPSFGNPVARGGFPIEQYPYYRPHIPPVGLANSMVPHPGAGPRGQHPKNGDVYRPHMPDAYIRPGPGMPIRPGFYPGPMSYDGYYGPPMGYYNSNEQDIPYMGMAAGPSVYNRYSRQNPLEPGNPQGRSGGYRSAEKPLASEQVDSSHPPDTGGPYKVILKQHNEQDGRNGPLNWEDSETVNASHVDRKSQPRIPGWDNEQRSDDRKNSEKNLGASVHCEEASFQTLECQGSNSSILVKAKSPESTGKFNTSGDVLARKLNGPGAASGVPEGPLRPSAPKDSSLIQKIETLNAKVRYNSSAKSRDDQRNKFYAGNAPVNSMENEDGTPAVLSGTTPATEIITPPPCEVAASGEEKNLESLSVHGTASSRQTAHGMQVRAGHCNKGRFSTHDTDGWQEKSVFTDSSTSSGVQLEASNVHVGEHLLCVETYNRSGSYHQVRHDRKSLQTMSDPTDSQAQRAKVKELAKQRTMQLQEEEERTRKQKAKAFAKLDELNKRTKRHDRKSLQTMSDPTDSQAQRAKVKELAKQRTMQLQEEEEWTRKQKAKAFAKLDELNKRTKAVEGSAEKEYATSSTLQNKQEELQFYESTTVSGKSGAVDAATLCNANVLCPIQETSINEIEKSPSLSGKPPLETQKNASKQLGNNNSLTLHQDVNSADATSSTQVHNNIASKLKRTSYKQKQNFLEKTSNQKLVSTTPPADKVENDTMVDVTQSSLIARNDNGTTCGSSLPIDLNAMTESSVNQKKKNNRNGKNRCKVEETSSLAALPLAVPKEASLSKNFVESVEPKASEFELDQDSAPPASFSNDPHQPLEQPKHIPNEEYHGRASNQWKSQHSRRMPRNIHATRPAEKSHGSDAVMWAPVKPYKKTEIMDDSTDKIKTDVVDPLKGDLQMHNNTKNRRAELERYIPKPVAKEMVQQGCIQQGTSSANQAAVDECVGQADSGSQGPQITLHTNTPAGKVGSGMESKKGDGRLTKPGKSHGSCRQCGSAESTRVRDKQDEVNHDSNSGQSFQRSTEHKPAQKSLEKGQVKHICDSSDPGGSNKPGNHNLTALDPVPVIKDQTLAGRGRWVPFRGQKGTGANLDAEHRKNDGEAGKNGTQISSSLHIQHDAGAASKESQLVGESPVSHWQPKSQISNDQRGNRPHGRNASSEVSRVNKKDSKPHVGVSIPAGCDKETNAHVVQPHHDQSISENSKAEEAPNLGNHDAKRERRNIPSKVRPHSPNQVPDSSVEQAPTSMNIRHEQHPSSGFRKSGNQNRFGRGHESRGDWKSPGQDNRDYNVPVNRERQGQNLHYEYHSLGPYDNSKDGDHTGTMSRERGQNHSRQGRGDFYGRQGVL